MQIQEIELAKLVPHESMATEARMETVPDPQKAPIVVKPIWGTDRYYIVDGTNRAHKSYISKAQKIPAVVATPDFSVRLDSIIEQRISRNRHFPLKDLTVGKNDIERQHKFFLDTDRYSKPLRLNTHRGTMVKLKVDVSYEGRIDKQFCLALKGSIGALVFKPELALSLFKPGVIDEEKFLACWGSENDYNPEVLPSYLELGANGTDFWAGGYALRQAFREVESTFEGLNVKARGKVKKVSVIVLYPNGLVYEGEVAVSDQTIMLLWSDALVTGFTKDDVVSELIPSPYWWKNPTSLIINQDQRYLSDCVFIEHSCGSTCVGGGCSV